MNNHVVLTTDSGMCPNSIDSSLIIPDQITCSNGEAYLDNKKDITTNYILSDKKNTYKTAAPLLTDYERVFSKILDDKKDIIHLSLGGGISSSSVNNANLVASEMNQEYENKVHVIDSCTGSVGGTCFYEASYQRLINSNLSTDMLKNELEKLKYQIKTSFYVPDATGFLNSGRDKSKNYSFCQGVLSLSSSLLKRTSFKFRVDFHENGDLYLKKIFRGTKKNGMLDMTRDIINFNTMHEYEPDFCVIGNLHQRDVNMEELEEYLMSLNYFNKVIYSDVGNVVAPYGCDDLCGISLIKKKNSRNASTIDW